MVLSGVIVIGSWMTPLSNFLTRSHFARLGLDAHVLVDDADAAFLRDGDREARFGDRVHGRGEDRQIEPDRAGELRAQVDVARQEFGVCRDQQHVVEGECFLENTHGSVPTAYR